MRLWSIHPEYLDRQGLTAVWREALLAQAVLAGRTKGYRGHPQLVRFREHPEPLAAVGTFLWGVAEEATAQGYSFDRTRIDVAPPDGPNAARPDGPNAAAPPGGPNVVVATRIPVTEGQIAYEWRHLLAKLERRSPERFAEFAGLDVPQAHPLFTVVPGPVESWERPK